MHNRSKSRIAGLALAGALAVTGAVIGVGTAGATASETTGTVHVWVTQGKGAVSQILLTGAIAEHGTSTAIDKDGKVNENGEYARIKLPQGSFEVNAAQFDQQFAKLQPTIDKATCSAWDTVSADVTLFDGTGSYAGISGTVRVTTSDAYIEPRYATGAKKGQCNFNVNKPLAYFYGPITGSGVVSF